MRFLLISTLIVGVAADALPVHGALRALEANSLRNYASTVSPVNDVPEQGKKVGTGEAFTNVTQIHLALGKTPDVVSVSWTCQAPTVVAWGLGPGTLNNTAMSTSARNYTMVSVPRGTDTFVNYTSGIIHHAQLTGLFPSTTYFYQIVPADNTTIQPRKVYSFTTAPAMGDTTPMTFDVLGDLGQTNDSAITMDHMIADQANQSKFIVHAGDMSYADCLGTRWDSYFDLIEPLASQQFWMVAAGNHEVEPNNLTGKIMDPYKARFAMPEVQPEIDTTEYYQTASNSYECTPSAFTGSYDYGNSFYSFRSGMVHFIVLNSYSKTDATSNQYKWLQAELASVNRLLTPWVIAIWHSPWYNSNKDHQNEYNTVNMRNSMETLLNEGGVALVFNGHVHAYERSHPVYLNQTNSSAPVYVVIGDGGNREGHADAYNLTSQPSWSAYRNASDFGHGRVHILNASHLVWEWHINKAAAWVISDSAVITNPVSAPAPPSCNATDLVTSHFGAPALCAYENHATGHKSVGYGFDMETVSARGDFAKLGLDYDSIFFGRTCLNISSVNRLLQLRLFTAAFEISTAVRPVYSSLCCGVANALVDISYNISAVTPLQPISKMQGLIQAVISQNWTGASDNIKASSWCQTALASCNADAAAVAKGCPNGTIARTGD